jgi:hypothetical protein
MAGIGFVLVPIVVVILLIIGSTFFRAAVAVANKLVGPVKPSASLAWDWEAAEDDEELEEINRKLQAIPEPGLGQGMLIVLVVGVVQLLVGFLLGAVVELGRPGRDDFEDWFPVLLIDTTIGFALMTGMTSSTLPTTGRRAALATFVFYVITTLVVALIVAVIAFVLGSTSR